MVSWPLIVAAYCLLRPRAGSTMHEALIEDLRNGVRALRRGRGTTVMAALALTLGIGVNSAIFSVAHAFLLRVWQVRDPQALTFVRARGTDGQRSDDFPWTTVERMRLATRSLSALSAFDGSTVTVTVDGESEIVYADFVTGDYFSLLGLQMTLGRPLTTDDDQPGRPTVAVISNAYWRERFASDPHVIGKTVTLKDLVCTIVGVAGPDYFGRQTAGSAPKLTLPMTWHGALGLKDHLTFELLGRLRPNVSPEAARQELDTLYQQTLVASPAGASANGPTGAPITSTSHIELQSALRGDADDARFAREIWILQLVAGLVLLLAIVNVASLQLARGASRERELATRLALGATRPRLIRQLLAESLLIAAVGGLLGLCVAQWVADALIALTRGDAASTTSTVLHAPVVAFTVGLIVFAALLGGIVPALRLTRTNQTASLSTSLRTRGDDRAARRGWSLIVVQIALSVVLLIPATLLIRSIDLLARVDLGFDASHVLVMSVYPTLAGYEGPREMALYERLLDRLNHVPGVQAASFSRYPILRRARWHGLTTYGDRRIDDPNASFVVDAIAPRLVDVLGLRLLAGRDLARSDVGSSTKVAIVNQALADRYFPNGDAVGRALEYEGVRREIVGVVANMRFGVRDEQPAPAVYIAYTQAPADMLGQMWLKIRTTGDPAASFPTIRRELQTIAPALAPAWVERATESIASASAAEASLATLVSACGAMALFMSMVGLYSTLAQAVTRRTREIGLRMALGARGADVLQMILKDAATLVIAGLAVGIPGAWAGAQLVASFLFGVTPANLPTTLVCTAIVVIVSSLAALFPARRAASIDPMIALQRE
jgi:predicted permease